MSLNAAKLRRDLTAWFQQTLSIRTVEDGEERLAQIYHAYASDAEDVSGDVQTSLSVSDFRDQLHLRGNTLSDEFARQVAEAFRVYWTGATFAVGQLPDGTDACPNSGGTGVFSSETSSQVTAVNPARLEANMKRLAAAPSKSYQARAIELARVFDEATRGDVTVTIDGLDTTPFPTGPLPITNVCRVF